jgi:hypothetical protein
LQELEQPQKAGKSGGARAPSPTARMEVVNKVLSVMFSHALPVTYHDLEAAQLHPTTISLGLSTAKELGLTRSGGKKGLYLFTEEGEDYARNLTGKKFLEASDILQDLILKSQLWRDVVSLLRANHDIPLDPIDLTLLVEKKLGKKWSPAMRTTVADSFVSILSMARLIDVQSGKLMSQIGPDGAQSPNNDRYGPQTNTAIQTNPPIVNDSYEFREEGVFIRIRKTAESVALAKDLVDLLARRYQSGLQTTIAEEAPGKN